MSHWQTLLSSVESERLAGMKHEKRRRSFVLGRATVRLMLSELSGLAPADVQIRIEENGSLASPDTEWYISLAHSGDEAVAVASRTQIGVDLEISSDRDDNLLTYITHTSERTLVDPLPLDQEEKLLLCWTAKEAVLKALGTGLRRSPKSVRLTHIQAEPLHVCIDDVEGHAWDVAIERCGEYYLAVATPQP